MRLDGPPGEPGPAHPAVTPPTPGPPEGGSSTSHWAPQMCAWRNRLKWGGEWPGTAPRFSGCRRDLPDVSVSKVTTSAQLLMLAEECTDVPRGCCCHTCFSVAHPSFAGAWGEDSDRTGRAGGATGPSGEWVLPSAVLIDPAGPQGAWPACNEPTPPAPGFQGPEALQAEVGELVSCGEGASKSRLTLSPLRTVNINRFLAGEPGPDENQVPCWQLPALEEPSVDRLVGFSPSTPVRCQWGTAGRSRGSWVSCHEASSPAGRRVHPAPSSTHGKMPSHRWPEAWASLQKTVVTLCLLCSTSLSPTRGQARIPLETVKLWADTFGRDLYDTVTKYSGSLLLQKKYKDVEPSLKIKEVDGLELVRKFSEDMETMLRRKVAAVQNLVEAAEEADLNHEFNESLVFNYYNSVLINEKDAGGAYVELGAEFVLEANAHFSNLLVNTSLSSVQLPTNVYNKDPDILNGIYMSEALNPVFVENFQRDPTLTWQYFGSSTGFFRIYPGIKWTPDENGVITFDCRNRGWYIQAATSPKDIVIVMDTSGSMKGLRMAIAKHTVSTILDTLGENDFVNIISYNDYIHYIEPCFKGILVQADRDNREHFKQLVDKLMVKGVGVVGQALSEAFQILQQFQEAGQGSLCNQAIMLITDGAVEDHRTVLEKYNWPHRKVRLFTYLIGKEVSFADRLKWIACNNKGYYTQISTLADAQENVMEYLHVLSRPMVINHDHDITWTEAYMDSKLVPLTALYPQAQSMALLTTVAMPVFSKKNETRSHGILLGVVGSDVALRELMKLAPQYKLGVHGYAFLSTNNGYILSHPDLRPLYREGKKLKPKPNYNSVDLSEVEWEDRAGTLRTAMINRETGSLSMDVKVPLDRGKRVLFLTNDYFFTDISDTPFSLGVVLSRGHGEYVLLGNTSVEEGLHDLLHPDLSLASDWIYCVTDIDPEHRRLSQLEAVVRFLTGRDPALECDEELLQELLFDAVVTAPMEAHWTALSLNTSDESEHVVDMAFLGTRAGLLRSSLFVGSEKVSDKRFLTPADEASIFTLDHFPLWYRQAAEQPPGSMVFNLYSAEGRENTDKPMVVTVSTAVAVTMDNRTAIAAAVGVQMRMEFLRRTFWAATRQCGAAEGPCPESCQDSGLDCFVIDNNGFILISERPQEMGRFLGEVDGALMTQLLSMGVFSRVTMYDYQAMCKPQTHHHSASQPLVSPIAALLTATRWLVNELLLLLLEWSAWGSWRGDSGAEAKAVFHHSHKHKKQDVLQPCDTTYPAFVHETAIRGANGIVECGGCQKTFVMQQIPSSNLLLLVTDPACDCSVFPPVLQEPMEVKYNATVKCDKMRSRKLRRRPDACHAFHPEENAQDCGGTSDTSASLPLFLLPLGAWVLLPQLLR
ncbi:voltage-dependent calcium channel subunit alpha-2/delta-4 [Delphinus delphis]|uniref:voltage-dependent calcium channel subunit alpha-2/delta-4 n=1 Tax=Delphinus delphis TaxID=9728 RepID=UPI0028C43292|nr:voltage-dependent calcium channel subunit alpha-2/delta-4 [Delphinus delphis]